MLTRQPQARALTPARVVEHRHRRLRLQQQLQQRLQLQQQLQLQPRPRLSLHRRQGRRLRRGLVRLRHRGRSEIRNSFVGEADSFPYSWFLM